MKKILYILIIIFAAMSLFAGCTQPPAEGTPAVENAPQPILNAPSPKGTILNTNLLSNAEGNYSIPINSSWIGRTSYEMIGAETIIYHITADGSEIEVNPTLIHIGKGDSDIPLGAEPILHEMGTIIYSIPRIAYPYTPGTVDAVEFELLYADTTQMLQSAYLINNQGEADGTDEILVDKFSPSDATINGVAIMTSQFNTHNALGEPTSTEEQYYEGTGDTEIIETYPFGEISFIGDMLVKFNVQDATVYGPRNITVGMTLSNVLNAFNLADIEAELLEKLYYGYETEFGILIPPSARLVVNDDGAILRLSAPPIEGYSDCTSDEMLQDAALFEPYYSCMFYFDTNNVLTSFLVDYTPDSE